MAFEFEGHVPDPVLLAQPLLQCPLDLFHPGQVRFVDDHVRLKGEVVFVELPDVHVMHVAYVRHLTQIGGNMPGIQILRCAFHQNMGGLTEKLQTQQGDVDAMPIVMTGSTQ